MKKFSFSFNYYYQLMFISEILFDELIYSNNLKKIPKILMEEI